MQVTVIPVVVLLTVAVVLIPASPLSWRTLLGLTPAVEPTFIGGCGRYVVYAQSRWEPVGASVRKEPQIEATKIASYSPNEVIVVDGWIHAQVAYPLNPAPWNSDIWFHVADDQGWVSFAAVRGIPTTLDPTGEADGGQPATTPTTCQGKIT